MATYTNIVFLQGDEATDFLDVLSERGESVTVTALVTIARYVGQEQDTQDTPRAGTEDVTAEVQGFGQKYLLTYNFRLGYIGLERINES